MKLVIAKQMIDIDECRITRRHRHSSEGYLEIIDVNFFLPVIPDVKTEKVFTSQPGSVFLRDVIGDIHLAPFVCGKWNFFSALTRPEQLVVIGRARLEYKGEGRILVFRINPCRR